MRISDWSSDVCSSDLPAHHCKVAVSEAETVDWACRAALERLGVATSGEIAAFWDLVTPEEAKAWCLAGKGKELCEVLVESAADSNGGGRPRAAYAFADSDHGYESWADLPEPPQRLRVLSPFDPLIRRSEEHTSELQSLMRI